MSAQSVENRALEHIGYSYLGISVLNRDSIYLKWEPYICERADIEGCGGAEMLAKVRLHAQCSFLDNQRSREAHLIDWIHTTTNSFRCPRKTERELIRTVVVLEKRRQVNVTVGDSRAISESTPAYQNQHQVRGSLHAGCLLGMMRRQPTSLCFRYY